MSNQNSKFSFYVLNQKGYSSLDNFIKEFGSSCISYIVSSRDKNIQNDYYDYIKSISISKGIPFFERNSFPIQIEENFSGIKFSIGWRWIIKNEKNLIVFHDSLLPKYRGFAPLVTALINGEKKIGVTALFASAHYDTGEIISQKSVDINYPIKIQDAINKLLPSYFSLLKDIYLRIKNNQEISSIAQNDNEASYSVWLDNRDYFINWSWDSKKIKRFIDAVGYPYDNAKTKLNNEVVEVLGAEVFNDVRIEDRKRNVGKIIFYQKNSPVIICGVGLLLLSNIKNSKGVFPEINFRSRFE